MLIALLVLRVFNKCSGLLAMKAIAIRLMIWPK